MFPASIACITIRSIADALSGCTATKRLPCCSLCPAGRCPIGSDVVSCRHCTSQITDISPDFLFSYQREGTSIRLLLKNKAYIPCFYTATTTVNVKEATSLAVLFYFLDCRGQEYIANITFQRTKSKLFIKNISHFIGLPSAGNATTDGKVRHRQSNLLIC